MSKPTGRLMSSALFSALIQHMLNPQCHHLLFLLFFLFLLFPPLPVSPDLFCLLSWPPPLHYPSTSTSCVRTFFNPFCTFPSVTMVSYSPYPPSPPQLPSIAVHLQPCPAARFTSTSSCHQMAILHSVFSPPRSHPLDPGLPPNLLPPHL